MKERLKTVVSLRLCVMGWLVAWCGLAVYGATKAKTVKPRASVIVVQAVAAVPAAERAYAASLAKQTEQALVHNGVKAELVSDVTLEATLTGRTLAFLVTCARPTAGQLAALARFQKRGGRLVPLYSASPELVAQLGQKPRLKVKDDDAAKERFLLSSVDAALTGTKFCANWESRRKKSDAAARALALKQRPRAGEIHAVWEHSGEGLYPGDWPRTFRLLKANGVTDLFVNVAGAGFAHYSSLILPRSKTYATRGDQLAACLAASRGTGIRVHAWLICFNATRASPVEMSAYTKRGWRLKNVKGALTEYLDPSNVDLRWRMFKAVEELGRNYPVDGVHLDFVRWYEGARKPADAAAKVTSFVEGARAHLRKVRPCAWLTAAVLGSETALTSVGQDWMSWLDRGLVDYAVPMNYLSARADYAAAVRRQGVSPQRARRIIGGIGVTANESRLSAAQTIDQIKLARSVGFAGVSLFDLNPTLAGSVLPILRLGLFK